MMASGEIRLSGTMMRRMPVLAQGQLPTITVTGNNSALSSNFFDPSSLGTNAGAQFWPQINSSGNQLAPVTVTARRSYVDNYVDFVSTYAINVGPYATALAGGLWPKSWAPATNFRPPLLGSTNPLTSVPRAFGMAGADSVFVQTGAAGIGLLTVGIGFYDIGIELEGFIYALPDVSAPAPSPPIFPY